MMPLKREPIKEYTDKQVKQMFSDEILDDLIHSLGYRDQAKIVEGEILNELKNKNLDKRLKK